MVFLSLSETLILVACLIVFAVAPLSLLLLSPYFVARGIFRGHFFHYPDDPRTRHPSSQEPIQLGMFKDGLAFAENSAAKQAEVALFHDGLLLKGLYFDYGRKKTLIMVPGRLESAAYSLYFAQPYEHSSFNLLLIDQRACGESDGFYCTGGVKESQDLLAWIRYLHEEKKVESIYLQGSCIGSASVVLALSDPACPPYVKGALVEGLYGNIVEMVARHSVVLGHSPKSIYKYFPALFKKEAGVDVLRDSPEKRVPFIHQPILFLQSKEDAYIAPAVTEGLFEACPSANKKLLFFEKGEHSRIRYESPKEYDAAVLSWMESLPE
jgi:pimeloyl-ACP methyl ester carboxylesterase